MTGRYRGIDSALYSGLDSEVAEVLSAWADLHRRHYALDRWLVNGRSRQPVAVVRETDNHTGKTTMLILKVLSPQNDSLDSLEFARHRQAEHDRSPFATSHLSTFFHDAVFVPSTREWITFQRVAAKSFENTEVLTVLLLRMLGLDDSSESPTPQDVVCNEDTFTDVCRAIVAGVLGWAGAPFIRESAQWDLPTFFGRHLFDQMKPEGRLGQWAHDYQSDMILLDRESEPLPNPFAVAQGRVFADAVVAPLQGHSHGDLHTDNALIRVRPHVDVNDYYLIDIALYESDGPLTRDPAHLILYIIARSMEAIAPAQQSALIDLLLDPLHGPARRVPGWLAELIHGIDAETRAWVEESGLEREWREQTYLSLAACAMLFLGRTSTREQDKPWFLRLAARAIAQFARERRLPMDGSHASPAAEIGIMTVPQPDSSEDRPSSATADTSLREGADGGASRPKGRKKGSTYNVTVTDAKGVQIGDSGRQINHF